jgi:hypothetical protein
MITLNRDRGALCLGYADLDHLEFLASGDAAVTRRASKHSQLRSVVLHWSAERGNGIGPMESGASEMRSAFGKSGVNSYRNSIADLLTAPPRRRTATAI